MAGIFPCTLLVSYHAKLPEQKDPSIRQVRNHLVETQTVFVERFGLSRHDKANYGLGQCDIPTKVLAELDRIGINLSWLLNGLGEMFAGC